MKNATGGRFLPDFVINLLNKVGFYYARAIVAGAWRRVKSQFPTVFGKSSIIAGA